MQKYAEINLEGTKGVPRNGCCKYQLAWSCFALSSLHVQTLMLTDVQTTLLGAAWGRPTSSSAVPQRQHWMLYSLCYFINFISFFVVFLHLLCFSFSPELAWRNRNKKPNRTGRTEPNRFLPALDVFAHPHARTRACGRTYAWHTYAHMDIGIGIYTHAHQRAHTCTYTYIHMHVQVHIHPVSVTRFPSFRTQPLENLSHYLWTNGFLSNPAPGENLERGILLWRQGVHICRRQRQGREWNVNWGCFHRQYRWLWRDKHYCHVCPATRARFAWSEYLKVFVVIRQGN